MRIPRPSAVCTVGAPGPCLVSRIASFAIPLAIAVAACASGAASQSPAAPSAASPVTQASPAVATAAPVTPAPATPGAAGSAAASPRASVAPPTGLEDPSLAPSGPAVAIDHALAAMLPTMVDGLPVTRSTDTEAAAAGSPVLGGQADGFAAAQVIAADAADLAIVSMIRLKPAIDATAFFGDYRPSFDDAACAPAGGVSTRETRTIGGRTVDATLCLEGASVYHLLLDDGRIIVSVLEAGTKGYGRTILEDLKG
jgi:hypothetical protein